MKTLTLKNSGLNGLFSTKMTLEDGEEPRKPTLYLHNKMGIGEALKSLLLQAEKEARITCGVYESAQILEESPDNVMLCVLPDMTTDADVTLNIHFTLIEAFCLENDIYLVKVDCAEKLSKLFSSTTTGLTKLPVNDNDVTAGRSTASLDFNCLLVEYPRESSTEAEEDVVEFCKSTMEYSPYPIIELPV